VIVSPLAGVSYNHNQLKDMYWPGQRRGLNCGSYVKLPYININRVKADEVDDKDTETTGILVVAAVLF